jgi:MoaA/NifB/PqqE/SkfB family radical SAM enzyme
MPNAFVDVLQGLTAAAVGMKKALARRYPPGTPAGAVLRGLYAPFRRRRYGNFSPPGPACPFPWAQAMIMPDGHVRTCCYNDARLGNVNSQSFDAIWNGPGYRLLRERLLRGEYGKAGCGDCPMYSRSGWTTEQAAASLFTVGAGTPLQQDNARRGLEALRQNRGRTDASPVVLAVELSNRCNYDCVFCFQTDRSTTVELRAIPEVLAHLDKVSRLVCTGGEPFAIKETLSLLRSITPEAARHLSVEFYTNGALLHKHWDLLRKFDNVFFVVSLHSLDSETYRRIMVSRTDVREVVANIDRVLELAGERPGWKLSLSNVVMKSTILEAPALARFAVSRSCEVGFYHMHGDNPENIFEKPELFVDRERGLAALREACAVLERAGPKYATARQNIQYCLEQLGSPAPAGGLTAVPVRAAAETGGDLLQISLARLRIDVAEGKANRAA